MGSKTLEKALSVPVSDEVAHVFVLDAQGRVAQRAKGQPTQAELRRIESAVERLTR